MDRTIIVGDLHGCYEETVELLEKCQITHNDRVIFLGDLIDRGPENAKCVDLVRDIEQRQGSFACVLGNHEERHLEYYKNENTNFSKIPQSHIATRLQLKKEHYEYFETLPLFLRLPEFNVACVHAGAFPNRTLEEQVQRHILHVQMINPEHSEKSYWPSNQVPGYKFWTHFWNGPEKLVFGHSVFDKPLIAENAIGIDGGAVFGLNLHALILPTFEIVTVSGKADYGKNSRGNSPSRIKKFVVHDDVSTFS